VIPLSCVFTGLSVLVDRHSGAQRELLAAPIPRAYLVLGNLVSAMPGALTDIAKALPLTHALALMRYGFVDHRATGLHDIWGMSNANTEAWLSLAVVALFAAAFTAISIRAFSRSAVS